MEISYSQCCAVSEITNLQDYQDCPEKAMKAFCKRFEQPLYAGGTYKKIGMKLGDLGAFYIFTGVVGNKEDSDDDGDWVDETEYGQQFAAYILKNKLGSVTESPARYNRANHPTHLVRVWIWTPSLKGLNTWWEKNKGR